MKARTTIDFTGQDFYIGLDVHKNNWRVSIYTNEFEHKTFTQNPNPQILINYLHHHFPGANYHSVYEAGYCGFWIHDALAQAGIDSIVVNPADVPTKDKERKRKNNRVDARKLARSLRSHDLDAIYIPTQAEREDRQLIRTRRNTSKETKRYMNQIKAFLQYHGIKIPQQFSNRNWSGAFIAWLKQVKFSEPTGTKAFRFHIDDLLHFRQRLAELNREIRHLSKTERYHQRVKLLLSIPGIGLISAMILLTELMDMNRFKNLDELAAFVGLVPGEYSSGDDDDVNVTGISSRGNRYLRSILIECAWVAIKKDPALMHYYKNLIKRMAGQKAIVRVARKLLNRIRFVLQNNQQYQLAVVE